MSTGFYLLDNPNPNAPQYAYPRRGVRGKLTGTCIVHTAEGYGAEGMAAFIARRSDYGSYHRLSDWNVRIPMLPWEYEAWQDSETNNWAVGISAAVKAADWYKIDPDKRERVYRNMAKDGAEFVIYMRESYNVEVPRVRITGEQARASVPGFCAHGDSGIHRSDPGRDFDWNLFFQYINEELEGDELSTEQYNELNRKLDVVLEFTHRAREVLNALEDSGTRADVDVILGLFKTKDNSTIYELKDGKLRGLSYEEWVLMGQPAPRIVTQDKLDAFKAKLAKQDDGDTA